MCDTGVDAIVQEIIKLVVARSSEFPASQTPLFNQSVFMKHMADWLNTSESMDAVCPHAVQKTLGLQMRYFMPGKNTLVLGMVNKRGEPVSAEAAKSSDIAVWMNGACRTKTSFVPPNKFTFTFEPLLCKPVKLRIRVNGQNIFDDNGGIRELHPGFQTRAHCTGSWCVDMAELFTAVCPVGCIKDICTDGVLLACEQKMKYSTHTPGRGIKDHWEFSRNSGRAPHPSSSKVVHYAHDESACAFILFDKATKTVVTTIDRSETWLQEACISSLLQISDHECIAVDAQNGRCIMVNIQTGTTEVLSQFNLQEPVEYTEVNACEARFYWSSIAGSSAKQFHCMRWNWREGKPVTSWTLSSKAVVTSVVSNQEFVFVSYLDRSIDQLSSTDGLLVTTFDARAVLSPMATLRLLMPNPYVLVILDNVYGCISTWDICTRQLLAASRHTDLLRLQCTCVSAMDNHVYMCSSSGRLSILV